MGSNFPLSNQNLRLLVSKMEQGVALCDIICGKNRELEDYRFIRLNKKIEEQTGYKIEDLLNKTVIQALPETGAELINKCREVVSNKASLHYDEYFSKSDKWNRVSAYPLDGSKFVLIMDDITERKRLEEIAFLEKEQLKTTLLSVGDGVITTDEGGNITLMNSAAEKMTGYSQDISVGRDLKEIFSIKDELMRGNPILLTEKVLKDGEVLILSDHKILTSISGTEIFVEGTVTPIKDSKGHVSGMVLVFRDNTEKLEHQREVEFLSIHDHLTGLYNRRYIQDSLSQLDTPKNLPLCIIYSDVNGLKMVNDCFGHEAGDRLLKTAAQTFRDILRSDDIVGRFGGDEFLILLPKTDEDVAQNIIERISGSFKKTDMDHVIVSLATGFSIKKNPTQHIDDVLKNAESCMYMDKIRSGKIMRRKMIENVIREINSKYEKEEIHSEKVSEYCIKTGKAVGLSKNEISELKTAALLHDIGKIVMPPELINKTEKLSEEEYDLIKKHPEKGYQILKSIDEYTSVAEAVLHHHEHWDGGGYPEGLKEDEIHLYSRIINVAGAYETMTSGRPYKKAITQEEAVAELKKYQGRQFDPKIVKIFIEEVLS
ncbi:MAG: diguanylate cyclase [Synergistaceae bacterium]|nr:diguanylate cyclase [Synergistaceae bacterium]